MRNTNNSMELMVKHHNTSIKYPFSCYFMRLAREAVSPYSQHLLLMRILRVPFIIPSKKPCNPFPSVVAPVPRALNFGFTKRGVQLRCPCQR